MRRALSVLLVALPQFVLASPCAVMPYASQCQGSNLWTVPVGWNSDSNGDCLPTPAVVASSYVQVPAPQLGQLCYLDGSAQAPWATSMSQLCVGNFVWEVLPNEAGCKCTLPDGRTATYPGRCYPTYHCPSFGYLVGTTCAGYVCPEGTTPLPGFNSVSGGNCKYAYPSNGSCQARTLLNGTLQRNPLDPDCSPTDCVFDGTCQLR